MVFSSRRRSRRTSGTLAPPKSVPGEVEPTEEKEQQLHIQHALPKDLSHVEQGAAKPSNTKPGSNATPQPLQPDLNVEPITVEKAPCGARSPIGNQRVEIDIGSPFQAQLDSVNPFGNSEKDNIRTKWFFQGTNSPGPTEKSSPVMMNGDLGSTCSSKRPSLESEKEASEEINSNQLQPEELPLRKRKSLSDSLLCTVSQNDVPTQNGDLVNGTPSDQNIYKARCAGEPKGKCPPNVERKQNYSKQNGSPFSHKKALHNNEPCSKHSDEEINNQRNRTTTHPCYDPSDLPKGRRRNAACTVTILSPKDRASENDFLETKI